VRGLVAAETTPSSGPINRLHTRDGEPLFLIEASEGGYLLRPYDPGFEEKMAKAEDIISRYRNTLHVRTPDLRGKLT
jgi:hypothetical protein